MFENETYKEEYGLTLKTISNIEGIGTINVTTHKCYFDIIDYMLPKNTVYWIMLLNTRVLLDERNKTFKFIVSYLYLTPSNQIILELNTGNCRKFIKMRHPNTIHQIINNFLRQDNQKQLKALLKSI